MTRPDDSGLDPESASYLAQFGRPMDSVITLDHPLGPFFS